MSLEDLHLKQLCCDCCNAPGPAGLCPSAIVAEAEFCGWEVGLVDRCPRCVEQGIVPSVETLLGIEYVVVDDDEEG